jgi:hypothetical protein
MKLLKFFLLSSRVTGNSHTLPRVERSERVWATLPFVGFGVSVSNSLILLLVLDKHTESNVMARVSITLPEPVRVELPR